MSILVELPPESYPKGLPANLANDGGYDFATACALAWMSQLAYETAHPDKIDQVLAGWGLTRTKLLKSAGGGLLPRVDTRAIIAEGWGGTIVAFGGTDPLVAANWLTNFDTLPSPDDAHRGFENAVKSVWPELRSAVVERDHARPLFFAGHSLGGALAVVAARLLENDGSAEVSGVYTFGMPRCGGRRFAEDYARDLGARTYRLVHGDDVVPTVPPSSLGFRHVGCLLCCRRGEKFDRAGLPLQVQSDEPMFVPTALRGVRNLFHLLRTGAVPAATQPGPLGEAYRFLPPWVGDHIPSRYLHALGFDL